MKIPSWVTKVNAIWIAIGLFLTTIGLQGASIPSFLPAVFSQEFWDATLVAISGVIGYFQYVRNIFVKKAMNSEADVLSNKGFSLSYFINPTKVEF